MTTVTRDDVIRHPSGLRKVAPITTAHQHLARFYIEAERQRPTPSWAERIASAPSPFSVDGLLVDFALFGSAHASEKTHARVYEVARVRKCALAGVLP